MLNDIEIIDRRTRNYFKQPLTALISSRSFPEYMDKNISNNLENDTKNLIKSLCETQSHKTNNKINTTHKKKKR